MQGNQLIERSMMSESMLDKRSRPEEDFFPEFETYTAKRMRLFDIEGPTTIFDINPFFQTEY
jgi:hypothetical protein